MGTSWSFSWEPKLWLQPVMTVDIREALGILAALEWVRELISCEPLTHISDIKLIRTDTTLDLSQKTEKVFLSSDRMTLVVQLRDCNGFQYGGKGGRGGPNCGHVLDTILTLWLADKSGRRLLLIVSSSAMALSLLVVSVGAKVMVIAFSLGLGAMPWIIMSEILPINIKGLAGSFATLANWFFSWLVTLTANLLLDWSSGGTFTIYTAVCVFTAGFVAIWVPETKGKTLEEIQQFFR
ncbi:hypothetical protein KIW84_071682 [Lathyrus oleraceus]|uniref:Major facilitator superfamily (MFS) profile domain-containing protein n=1 Tax=Pisum sativum TaxID=3888 RepID=A0A9D4VJE8_PEA|nr:hypothetical protein KIW84_071682 [Pisum sativum]